MFVTYLIILVFSFDSSHQSEITISDEVYPLLPPIFHIDPYEKCVQEKKSFCRVALKLAPLDPNRPSDIWQIIEQTKTSKEFYRHDELFHVICLNNVNMTVFKNNILQIYNQKYNIQGLNVTIMDINCDNFQYNVNLFDIIVLFSLVSYFLLIGAATFYDTSNRTTAKKHDLITLFSLRSNLIKVREKYQRPDFEDLRCIQAVRFYTTVSIIFFHTFCSFAGAYVADTAYFEHLHRNFFRRSLRILFVFLVQTFFLISGWLLSYRTFRIFKNSQINVCRYAVLTFCNRYLRIIPPVLLIVSLNTSMWIFSLLSGPVKDIYSDREYQRCQKTWWANLLFLGNHYRQQDTCCITLWYLSADTQLYVVSLICLMLIQKFKQLKVHIMAVCLLIGIAVPSVISYLYDLEIIYRIIPEKSKNNNFLTFEFSATYTSTYANLATYMLGLILGYVYYRCEHVKHFGNKSSNFLWWTASVGPPLAVVAVSSYEYHGVASALLAGLLKPLYALGVGVAIFGMSKKRGGLLRIMCEWKPAVFLGNFTYSTYVVHFLVVFYRVAESRSPLRVSDTILLMAFIQDAVLSFVTGFLVYLIIEMPLSQLQQVFVPKYSIHKLVKCNIKSV